MEENITCKVSVLCAAYNHEEYLRQTLDSFLNQKTDFPFEVLVNDDASTDSTGDIIREYAAKYPDVIRPFYQKENLYSRRINLYDVVFFPACRGEYIAVCEGDDYWNDPEKLQLQVNWLDTHPEYSACVHNSIGHFADQPDKVLFAQDGDRDIPFDRLRHRRETRSLGKGALSGPLHVGLPDRQQPLRLEQGCRTGVSQAQAFCQRRDCHAEDREAAPAYPRTGGGY